MAFRPEYLLMLIYTKRSLSIYEFVKDKIYMEVTLKKEPPGGSFFLSLSMED